MDQALDQLERMVDTDFYGAVVDLAREKGAQMSIYDEYGFPIGSMGAINGNISPAVISRNADGTFRTELTIAPSHGMFLISR